jgi:hypothetical protein
LAKSKYYLKLTLIWQNREITSDFCSVEFDLDQSITNAGELCHFKEYRKREHENVLLYLLRTFTETSCRFELTIGQNALQVSDDDWAKAIASFTREID